MKDLQRLSEAPEPEPQLNFPKYEISYIPPEEKSIQDYDKEIMARLGDDFANENEDEEEEEESNFDYEALKKQYAHLLGDEKFEEETV
jgi:hypothetical protein